ncbi:MAG: hypothetical protein GYA21_01000 [Myxococcales bacterium]|nr:hypothetical protein [Myxococcales bacterium]
MSVLPVLKSLLALQTVDLKYRELDKDRRHIPARIREIDATLAQARKELADLKNQYDEAELSRQMSESDLKAEKEKIRKWEARLNEIRTNRDYQALSREIEGARKANLGIEDEILRKMQEIEDLKKVIEHKQEDFSRAEKELLAERAELEAKLANINSRVQEQEAARKIAMQGIDGSWLAQYEAIRGRRDGIAMAAVLDEHCLGCHMGIPPQLYNIVLRGQEIRTCPNCARILYYEGALKENTENPAA